MKIYIFHQPYKGPLGRFEAGKSYPLDGSMAKNLSHVCRLDETPPATVIDAASAPVPAKPNKKM